MRPPSLRRTLLLWVVQWLSAWAERLLEQDAPAASPAAPPPAPRRDVDGPPAEWVEWVRQGAPELLVSMGLGQAPAGDVRPQGRPPLASTAPAEPPEARTARPRPFARVEVPAGTRPPRSPRPALQPAPAPPSRSPAPSPLPPAALVPRAPAPPPPASPAPGPEPAAASADAGHSPPPSKPRVLRWSERVHAVHRRQPARPEPLPEPRWPDPPARTPAEEPPRWPAGPAAASAPESLAEARSSPEGSGRWPELPPDQAPDEAEEGLLRRLERRHRIALEQRGD